MAAGAALVEVSLTDLWLLWTTRDPAFLSFVTQVLNKTALLRREYGEAS